MKKNRETKSVALKIAPSNICWLNFIVCYFEQIKWLNNNATLCQIDLSFRMYAFLYLYAREKYWKNVFYSHNVDDNAN